MVPCRHGCHSLFLSSWSVQKVRSESAAACSVGRSQKKKGGGRGCDCMHSPVLSKGTQTRRGSLHWSWLNRQQQPWGYPGLGHQNLFYSKGYFWWAKSHSNVTRRHFSARQALPLQALHRCCSPEPCRAWLSSGQLSTFLCLSSTQYCMQLSPPGPYPLLAVPWQPCAMHISSELAHMVTKINPVVAQSERNIWGLTVLE